MNNFDASSIAAIEKFSLSIYTNEEIQQMSVKHIRVDSGISPLRHAMDNGIYDLALGAFVEVDREACRTCQQRSPFCPGHCGHIELCFPVINALFWDNIPVLLSKICINCYAYAAPTADLMKFDCQNRLLSSGYPMPALEVPTVCSNYVLASNEAEEANVTAEGVEILQAQDLQYKLAKYVKKVKKIAEKMDYPTVHAMAIEREIIKDFKEPKLVKCCHCNSTLLKVSYVQSQLFISNLGELDCADINEEVLSVSNGKKLITPEEARAILRKCWATDSTALSCLYPFLTKKDTQYPTDLFFVHSLLVTPTQLRPFQFLGDVVRESEISLVYKEIIRISRSLKALVYYRDADEETRKKIPKRMVALMSLFTGNTWQEKVHRAWGGLQGAVNGIYDSALTTSILRKGIRQRVEKKEGLLRKNLMGKRVNYSARSLAAPDPYLNVDEIGVPRVFAQALSYPVPVTHWNAAYLRKLVINGSFTYPGANYIELENGLCVQLKRLNIAKRIAYAKSLITPDKNAGKKVKATKVVYRHLKDGDYVLMNRQPTLHKPSIQAHKVRVTVDDKVLRMPYANCKAYNADFDGDEINMHYIQGEMARAEAATLVSTHNNYLTPKDGSPLAGLIQDCVVASVKMTVRGKFFSENQYKQLVCNSLWNHKKKIRLMHPAILKPQKLWSGKQIISTVILNLIPADTHKPTFTFKTAVKCDVWQTQDKREWKAGGTKPKDKQSMTESEWVMRSGELHCGVVDKCAIGSTSFGLIHVCYDLYGGEVASDLMSAINRLCLSAMPSLGHTIGLMDFASPTKVSVKRRENIENMINNALDLVSEKVGKPKEMLQSFIKECHLRGDQTQMKFLESAYKTSFDAGHISKENEQALYRHSLDNNMKLMVDTGAKGSKINLNQMASLFGELTIDGKRIQMTAGGKTLPSFKPHDPDPLAGGYIKRRYISGMDYRSVFFLSMAGRDSLQHTAVKTANSGYMQRCLMKHLEGITVRYDSTVRNSDDVVLQFAYGEDGQDVCKMPFLQDYHGLDVIADNFSKIMDEKTKEIAFSMKNKDVLKYKKKTAKNVKAAKEQDIVGFRAFFETNKHTDQSDDINPLSGRSYKTEHLQMQWFKLSNAERQEWGKPRKRPDPVASLYNGSTNLGVVSESLDRLIDNYYDDKYSKKSMFERELTKHELKDSLHMKILHSKVDPGHAVGALCAQSIGEPLTQMTLNTFHLAGQDDLNITLGVPRMIEILRTASEKMSTPYMEIPFLPQISEEAAEGVKCKLTRLPFKNIVSSLIVEKVGVPHTLKSDKPFCNVTIKIQLWDRKYCKSAFNVSSTRIQKFAENDFVNELDVAICTACRNATLRVGKAFEKPQPKSATRSKVKTEAEDEDLEEEEVVEKSSPDSDVEDEGHESSARRGLKTKDYSDGEDSELDEKMEVDEEVPIENENDTKVGSIVVSKSFIRKVDFHKEKMNWIIYTARISVALFERINMFSVVKSAIFEASVRSVKDINQTFISRKDNGLTLKTDGVNFDEILKYHQYFDVNKFYTNNIITMSKMYGIEAAQRAIIKEIRTVQDAYNITVDFRHLSLLADYFTSEGVYKACSRHALKTCASPIQSFTFETAFDIIKDALIREKIDHMRSPSANILLGRPVKLGSNCMKILVNTQAKSLEHNDRIFAHMH